MLRTAVCLLAAALGLRATTVTVATSGGDYATIQAAMDAAAGNCAIDVIEVTAGQTFTGSSVAPYRPCTGDIWVRSTKWKQLPAEGTRVTLAHASLMPTLDTASTSVPILRVGSAEQRVVENGVNTTSDTLGTDFTFTVGTPVACNSRGAMPSPLVAGTKYFVKTLASGAITLSSTLGGSTIDITTAGSATEVSYYARPWCAAWHSPSGWRFTGIRFAPPAGFSVAVINFGLDETHSANAARNNWLDRSIIDSPATQDGPKIGVWLSGVGHKVTDSWIGWAKSYSAENKAVQILGLRGAEIRNNYLGAVGAGVFAGGGHSNLSDVPVAENVDVVGNHIEKPAFGLYIQGSGAPSRACYYANGTGAYYRNTAVAAANCTGGGCYKCLSNGTWSEDTALPFRNDDWLPKASIEFKGCENCKVSGNILEGGYTGPDTGNTGCVVGIQISDPGDNQGASYLRNTKFTDNWCKNQWSGVAFTSASSAQNANRNRNNALDNILLTMRPDPLALIHDPAAVESDIHGRVLRIWNNNEGESISRITVRSSDADWPRWSAMFEVDAANRVPSTNMTAKGLLLANGQAGTLFGDNLNAENCTGLNVITASATTQFTHWAAFGTSVTFGTCISSTHSQTSAAGVVFAGSSLDTLLQSKLQSSSPYSAQNESANLLNPDGTDLGIDADQLADRTGGVESGNGSYTEQARFDTRIGSTSIVVEYTAPDDSACTLQLGTHPRLTAGDLVFNSSTVTLAHGRRKQVVIPSLTAATTYYRRLTCGSRVMKETLRTRAAGSGSYVFRFGYSSARTLDHSANSNMSSPTSLSSATSHEVSVSTGNVRYVQPAGEPVYAIVAP